MLLKKELGHRIQSFRKKRKLTQEKFAELISIDPKNVSKIENGNHYPSTETLLAIAKALEVDIYELFIFGKEIPLNTMRQELLSALNDDKKVLYLYEMLRVF